MMTERKAGQIANKIYAMRSEKKITLKQALNALEKISAFLSATQLNKFSDLQEFARQNKHELNR